MAKNSKPAETYIAQVYLCTKGDCDNKAVNTLYDKDGNVIGLLCETCSDDVLIAC